MAQELKGEATIANFATVQKEGDRLVTRGVDYYNLDMILSIGYRVKSQRGIDFRKWANKVLKEYLLRGYAINQRIERLEQRVSKTEEKIDFFVRTSLPPVEGVFYDGQIFDAHVFVSNLIKSAKQRIILGRSSSLSQRWRCLPKQFCEQLYSGKTFCNLLILKGQSLRKKWIWSDGDNLSTRSSQIKG